MLFDYPSCLRKCQDVIVKGDTGAVEYVGFCCDELSPPVDLPVPIGHSIM